VNIFQSINVTTSLAALGACGIAVNRVISDLKPEDSLAAAALKNLVPILLGVFIILFRIKTMFDDHQHFSEERQKKGGLRHVGFILALFSWLFWVIAAYLVFAPARAAELMVISITISTAWIAVHLIELIVDKRRTQEIATALMREKWVLFNAGYIITLGVFIGWVKPVVPPQTISTLVVLFILFVFDYLTSRSYPTDNIG
jgi:hypothetical protein